MYRAFLLIVILSSCATNSSKSNKKTIDLASKSEIKHFLKLHNDLTKGKLEFSAFPDYKWHNRKCFTVKDNDGYTSDRSRSLYIVDVDKDGELEYIFFELDQGSGRYDFLQGIYKEKNNRLVLIDYSDDIDNAIIESKKLSGDTINYVSDGLRCCYFNPLKNPVISYHNNRVQIHWYGGDFEFHKNGLKLISEPAL
jgi:hypothetical protein